MNSALYRLLWKLIERGAHTLSRNYTPSEYEQRACEILGTKCIYFSFPIVDENCNPTGERSRRMHQVFDEQHSALDEELVIRKLVFPIFAESISSKRERPPEDEGARNKLLAQVREHYPDLDQFSDEEVLFIPGAWVRPSAATSYLITRRVEEFEEKILPKIAFVIEPDEVELRRFVDYATKFRRTILDYFGGREQLTISEYHEWGDREPQLLRAWAGYFLCDEDKSLDTVDLVPVHEFINDWPETYYAERYAKLVHAGKSNIFSVKKQVLRQGDDSGLAGGRLPELPRE